MTVEFRDFSVAQTHYPPGQRLNRHAHDYSNVSIVTCGQIEEAAEGGTYCARSSSVVLKAAGAEHEDRVGGFGATTLTIRFERDSPFGRRLGDNAWAWFDEPSIIRCALDLQRAFSRTDAADIERCAAALIESVVDAQSPAPSVPEWVTAMRKILEERSDERGMRFDALARDFGLHPVYASRAFRRYIGVSMRDFVCAQRLRSVRHSLSGTRRSIAAIAEQSGFADSSHLARTFTRRLGVSPRSYRRMTVRPG